jgi:hypothetical protein
VPIRAAKTALLSERIRTMTRAAAVCIGMRLVATVASQGPTTPQDRRAVSRGRSPLKGPTGQCMGTVPDTPSVCDIPIAPEFKSAIFVRMRTKGPS